MKTLKYLYQCNDTSLIKDFIQYTFAKNEGLDFVTFDAASVVLKLLKLLVQKPHTEFQECGKNAYQNMFNHLKPMISDLKLTEVSRMVDLAREERIEKCTKFCEELKEFHNSDDSNIIYLSKPSLKTDVESLLNKINC